MNRNASGRATLLLALLFLLGLAVTLLAWMDLQWTHRLFIKAATSRRARSISYDFPLLGATDRSDDEIPSE
ncbi:MAG: hypothetical protein ABI779_23750 [Acidobacteriota bacterium]